MRELLSKIVHVRGRLGVGASSPRSSLHDFRPAAHRHWRRRRDFVSACMSCGALLALLMEAFLLFFVRLHGC
jgi:hypothetical protein